MRKTRVLLVAGVALAWSSTVFAGVPAWCKGYDSGEGEYGVFHYPSGDGDDRSSIEDVVKWSCSTKVKDPKNATAASAGLADMTKRLYMNDADWSDAVDYVKEHGAQHTLSDIELSANTLAALTPMDQYRAIKEPPDSAHMSNHYLADSMDAFLTETGRMAYVETCLGRGGEIDPIQWAICAGDATKLDPNKVAAELRTDTAHKNWWRTALHIKLAEVMDHVKDATEQAKKLVKKDDAYGKLFDNAAKGRGEWSKLAASQKDALDLLAQLDSAVYFHSKKQFAGCEDKAFKLVADAASKIPASSYKGFRDEHDDPYGGVAAKAGPIFASDPAMNLAGTALAMCQPEVTTAQYLASFVDNMPGFRGPRNMGFQTIFTQKFELDDTTKELHMARPGDKPFHVPGSPTGSRTFIVASLKPDGDKIKVTSPKSSYVSDDCVKWHETNKIVDFDTAGRPVYQTICDKTGSVKHDTTPDDFSVTARTGKWLKPGLMFSAVWGENPDVLFVWASKTAKQPSIVLGGSVK
ncbi:MAG: hypothetical protein JO257_24910 [Deltaproteobacteria bacterium]|nr:hypothetical protein [Deltaproteobacteria bacterium]